MVIYCLGINSILWTFENMAVRETPKTSKLRLPRKLHATARLLHVNVSRNFPDCCCCQCFAGKSRICPQKRHITCLFILYRTQSTYKQNYHRAETKTKVNSGRRTSFNLLCRRTLTERHSLC